MPTYRITAPDGKTYRIEGPAGASQDEVIQAVLAQHPEAGGVTAAPEEPVAKPQSGFMPALKAGFSNLKGDVAALAGRTGLMDTDAAEKYIAEQEKYQKCTVHTSCQ